MSLIPNYDVRYICADNRYKVVTMAALTDVAHMNDPKALFQLHIYLPGRDDPAAYIGYYILHADKEIYIDLVVNTCPGTGLGAKLLNVICMIADRFRYSVRLIASPHYPVKGIPDRPAINLYRYYLRQGFAPTVDFNGTEASVEFVRRLPKEQATHAV